MEADQRQKLDAGRDARIDSKRRNVEQRDAATGEHDRMVGAMERVAADFNEQIHVFKARGD